MQIACVAAVANSVGESALWCNRSNRLWWVDIAGKCILSYDPETAAVNRRPMATFPTSIGLCQQRGFILGMRHDVWLWDGADEFKWLVKPEPLLERNRLNEGCVGPDGCYWVGTMQDNLTDDGSLVEMTESTGGIYRVTPAGELIQETPATFGICNTFVWLEDDAVNTPTRLITADTLTNTLYAYQYSNEQGVIGEPALFASGFDRGLPDGSCIDSEGYIWNCRVAGGGCLVRFRADGTIDRIVDLPCSWPTSCTFGGINLDTLYVTSARIALTREWLVSHPMEGGLFAFKPDVTGRPAYRFG